MASTNLDQQYPEKPWLDIAKSDFFQKEKAELSEIISSIDEYHLLKKTDKATLQNRIDKLDKIFVQINRSLTKDDLDSSTRKKLQQFAIQCNGKRTYLRALLNHEKANSYKATTPTLFGGITEIPDLKGKKETYLLRTLRPLSMPRDVTAQSRDPLRRYPVEEFNNLLNEWRSELRILRKQRKRSKEDSSLARSFPSFFMWLEDKDTLTLNLKTDPTFIKELMSVNKEILRPRQCRISDTGLILDENNKRLAVTENASKTTESPPKEFIYAISPKGELYLKKYDVFEAFFHSDIINHHIPVICAGHIKIANGKITYIDNNSGHFQPTPFHMEQALRLLSAKDVFSPVAKVKVSYMTKEKHVESPEYNIKDFDLKKLELPYTRQTRRVTEAEHNELKERNIKEKWPKDKLGNEWWKLGKPMTTEEIKEQTKGAFEEGIERYKAANVTKHFHLWKKKVQNIPADKKKPKPNSGPKA